MASLASAEERWDIRIFSFENEKMRTGLACLLPVNDVGYEAHDTSAKILVEQVLTVISTQLS